MNELNNSGAIADCGRTIQKEPSRVPFMNKLGLKTKLRIGFGAMLVIMITLGIVGYQATQTHEALFRGVRESDDKNLLIVSAQTALEKQRSSVRGFLLTGREEMLKEDDSGKKEYSESTEKLNRLLRFEEGKRLMAQMEQLYGQYRSLLDREIEARRAGKTSEALAMMSDPR